MAGYRGVGTAEFLYNPLTQIASFLEVNSRLQVEHTITELVAGCDLVKGADRYRTRVGVGTPDRRGTWACHRATSTPKIPNAGFLPSPGRVRLFQPPAGPGVRVDSGIREGMTIPAAFD